MVLLHELLANPEVSVMLLIEHLGQEPTAVPMAFGCQEKNVVDVEANPLHGTYKGSTGS